MYVENALAELYKRQKAAEAKKFEFVQEAEAQKAKAEAQIKELDTQIELNEMKIKMMEEQNALTLKFLQELIKV